MDLAPDPIVVAFALSCRTRYDMLRAVTRTSRTVGELAALVGIHQATASLHVARLVEAGLADVTADGNRRLVRARVGAIQFVLQEG